MDGTSSFLVRTIRLAWPGGNPLARAVDRLDGLVLIVAVALGLVLVPVMLAVGATVHANVLETGVRQAATRHAAVATLTAGAPGAGTSAGGYGGADTGRSGVPARWQPPGGAVHTGLVQAKDGSRAGAKVDIWLDEGGRVVAPPVAPADATVAGMMAGLLGWLAAAGLLALVRTGVHHALDGRRYRDWDREWARMAARPE